LYDNRVFWRFFLLEIKKRREKCTSTAEVQFDTPKKRKKRTTTMTKHNERTNSRLYTKRKVSICSG